MTAVKQQLANIIPNMPTLLPYMNEEDVQTVVNIFIKVENKAHEQEDAAFASQAALDDLLALAGSVEIPDGFDYEEEKESYLRESYENLD